MLISFTMVAGGLMLLAYGGDILVRAALSIARHIGISPLLTGVVVVGFGTSAPELLVSLDAAFRSQPDIAVGNVVGSNIANILLILGVASLIAPIACSDPAIRRDLVAVLLASVVLLGLGVYGAIPRVMGVVMVTLMAIYIIMTLRLDQQADDADNADADNKNAENALGMLAESSLIKSTAIVIISAGMLAFGADLLVDGATTIARTMGVSDAIIGLTLVAIGTSLPELAAAIMAATMRQTDVIIGNVFGSSLFNILVILGLTSLVLPLPIAPRMVGVDIPISIAAIILSGIMVINIRDIRAHHGLLFLALYGGYTTWLFF